VPDECPAALRGENLRATASARPPRYTHELGNALS
jgi:hypothetical protein